MPANLHGRLSSGGLDGQRWNKSDLLTLSSSIATRHNPNEFGFCSRCSFGSRHGIAQVNLALLIWLNENVLLKIAYNRRLP